MKPKLRSFGAGIIGCVLVVCPIRASAETLYEAMRDAYYYNPSVEAAARPICGRWANRWPSPKPGACRLWPSPAQKQINRLLTRPTVPGQDRDSRPLTAALQGTLPLYDGGAAANQVSQAQANVDAGYASLNNTEQHDPPCSRRFRSSSTCCATRKSAT